jgi:hypothetical protein
MTATYGEPTPNPMVVIGALQTMKDRRLAEEKLREQLDRRILARKRGYNGPLTRAELASQAERS